jgi:hypothetical protein
MGDFMAGSSCLTAPGRIALKGMDVAAFAAGFIPHPGAQVASVVGGVALDQIRKNTLPFCPDPQPGETCWSLPSDNHPGQIGGYVCRPTQDSVPQPH